ncbi:cysteine hydrolase [Cupriavidus sp. ISTL7]|nr:cysteine hydrolase [Cupriavidus sp. ISTL7]
MPQAKTLMDFAGATRKPADWQQASLVLIDHQREYVDGSLPLSGMAEAVAECQRLLAAARKAGAPVVHIQHHAQPGGAIFDPQGPYAELIAELAPAQGETVIVKHLPNAFAGTALADTLARTGRKQLVIAGFMTHMCVSATARAALDLGYTTTVVAAACATRDLPDPVNGEVVPAAVVHRTALTELNDLVALVVPDAGALAG